MFSVTLAHHYISLSVSVRAETSRAQHRLGCAVSNLFLKYGALSYEHRELRPLLLTVVYTRLAPPVQ
jgi:hypothetical protein